MNGKNDHDVENGAKPLTEKIVAKIKPSDATQLLSLKNELTVDEAISKTKFGLFNYVLISISSMVLFAVSVEMGGILYVFPVSECDLSLTSTEKGILGSATLVGIISASHLWGYLADTKGRRAVIMPTLFLAFFSSVAATFVQNFYLFTTFRFLNGFFVSGSSATIYAYLGEFHNNKRRSRAIMSAEAVYTVLFILVPVIAWAVINEEWQFHVPLVDITYKPWRLFFVLCSLPELIAALVLLFLPESPKFVLEQGRKEEAYEILQTVNRWNNGKRSTLEPFEFFEDVESIENRKQIAECQESRFPLLKSIWMQTAPLFKPPHLGPTLLVCSIQIMLCATDNGFFMFFGEIQNKMASNSGQRMAMCEIINMKPGNASSVFIDHAVPEVCTNKLELETLEQGLFVEVIGAIGQVLVALLINKVGKYPLTVFILAMCGTGGLLCMICDIPTVQVYGFSSLMVSYLALNVITAVAVDIYPTSLRAMAMCITLMFGRLGGVLGANVVAFLLENHCEVVFYASGSSMFVIAALAFFIPNIHEK